MPGVQNRDGMGRGRVNTQCGGSADLPKMSDGAKEEATITKTQTRNLKRNASIIRRNKDGEAPKAIARDLCLSVWAVYKICRIPAIDPPQAYPKTVKRSVGS